MVRLRRLRPRHIFLIGSLTLAAATAGWAAHTVLSWGDGLSAQPDNHVAATDSRVCRGTQGNNVDFDEVMGHFGLALPDGSTAVTFNATLNDFFGEYSLDLRFRTTPRGLEEVLAATGLPAPAPDTDPAMGGWPAPDSPPGPASGPCGLTPPSGPRVAFAQLDGTESPVVLAVDRSDPGHPTVWISALDL
ncbi:hypothetical protein [Peterkaempfera griseoplana]|uniref:hypothetical protein n=1 Tax=Peterkaempfera griseoplana TaxID=66896 RepID=UPI000AB30223|nr:hypothetical protein [Peterkaempfera griseoplana]